MATTKIKKMQKRIDELVTQGSQLSMSILNMRQMYEGSIQEKQAITGQLNNMQAMMTATIHQARGKTIKIKAATLEKIEDYGGIVPTQDGENIVLTLLTREELAAKQNDFDPLVDEVEE